MRHMHLVGRNRLTTMGGGRVPAAPSDLVITRPIAGQIGVNATWIDNSDNETRFVLSRANYPTLQYAIIISTIPKIDGIGGAGLYAVGSAPIDRTTWYKIFAKNEFGTSEPSNIFAIWVPTQETGLVLTCTTIIGAETLILNDLTIIDGATVEVNWGDGNSDIYPAGSGIRTHSYADAGIWTITMTKRRDIIGLDLRDSKLSGTIDINNPWPVLLTSLYLSDLPGLIYTVVANTVQVPIGLIHLTLINLPNFNWTVATGKVVSSSLKDLTLINIPGLIWNMATVGNLVPLTLLDMIIIECPNVTCSVWTNNIIESIRLENVYSEANVDSWINAIWVNKVNFQYESPVLDLLGGGNAEPSGIYQAANPPTTGKEKLYDLVNGNYTPNGPKWKIEIEVAVDWKNTGPSTWDKYLASILSSISAGGDAGNDSASLIGDIGITTSKSCGGVLAENGMIYSIPRNNSVILKVNPSTDEITSFGDLGTETDKCFGGVLALNGMIYGIPYSGLSVLKIDPSTDQITLFGNLIGTAKWMGGVVAPNGMIYGIPASSSSVLKIDPSNDTITTFGDLGIDVGKWYGGILAPNGMIYGIPLKSTVVLKIDPNTDTVSTFGNIVGTIPKWSSGVLAPNGVIYGMPRNIPEILRIDTNTDTVTVFGNGGGLTAGRYSGGVLAPNGMIYAIPQNNVQVLRIDPNTDETFMFGDLVGSTKWTGGVLAPNGMIYGMPHDSSSVLKIDPFGDGVFDINVLLSGYFNRQV